MAKTITLTCDRDRSKKVTLTRYKSEAGLVSLSWDGHSMLRQGSPVAFNILLQPRATAALLSLLSGAASGSPQTLEVYRDDTYTLSCNAPVAGDLPLLFEFDYCNSERMLRDRDELRFKQAKLARLTKWLQETLTPAAAAPRVKAAPTFIPFKQLKLGRIYRIQSRNLDVGVFTGKGFIGIRTKFGDRYLFEEYEYSTSQTYGTARATKCLGSLSAGIEIRERLATVCKPCGRDAVFDKPKDIGGKGWTHADDDTPLCEPLRPVSLPNSALFDELERYERLERESEK